MLFPMAIMATSYGICNVFSRIATIFAPYVAELKPENISQWVYVAVAGCALIASLSVVVPSEKKNQQR